jgi:hypothetical protein
MNKIYFAQKYELAPRKFVMKFSCTDLGDVRTDLSPWARSSFENEKIKSVRNRIELALQKLGFVVEIINFDSMSITAIKK